jgi:2-dehydro-3-deoxyphosphogluconate aldolase/(4S)-4-hydroxy-2-oxoglutarate aldolase
MAIDHFIGTQSMIITLDVDAYLFDKMKQISQLGFAVVELNTFDTDLLTNAITDFPMLRIGAGNIITPDQLEKCYQANVHFASSPGFMPSIAQTATIYSMNYLPGIATMSDAMLANSLGCHHVRPFPASLSFCSLLNKYFPLMRLYPAEVEWEETEHFLNLPSVAAVSIINPDVKQLKMFELV